MRRLIHRAIRGLVALLPREARFAVYRSLVECDPAPDSRLVLKIAETREELEACFAILHDAYVDSGFMKPDPSGMRVTIYHALPTTTTLCAKWDGEVVGTISLIRESAFGFPMQRIFDLSAVRTKHGNLAEVSALAVHRRFRKKSGGKILFPLMKFMYEYCTTFFDTRHLLIAVNPNRIEMYESLLFFERLTENPVDKYDFANGAPAVGATLDLHLAPEKLKSTYAGKPPNKNLYRYFRKVRLANIQLPSRRYHTTNDPVMTPDLLDHFFNVRTRGFAALSERKKALLHATYDRADYKLVLPKLADGSAAKSIRRQPRFSMKCPGRMVIRSGNGKGVEYPLTIVEFSREGFQARVTGDMPLNVWGDAVVRLGDKESSRVKARAIRDNANGFEGYFGFHIGEPDLNWKKFVHALERSSTHSDLEQATRFMT